VGGARENAACQGPMNLWCKMELLATATATSSSRRWSTGLSQLILGWAQSVGPIVYRMPIRFDFMNLAISL
jgi:hypothetical protein